MSCFYVDYKTVSIHVTLGSKFEKNKNSFAKKSEHSKENSLPQTELFWGGGSVKHFSKLAMGIYETCDCYFFNFGLITVAVVFNSTVHVIFIFC